MTWDIKATDELTEWYADLTAADQRAVERATGELERLGSSLGVLFLMNT